MAIFASFARYIFQPSYPEPYYYHMVLSTKNCFILATLYKPPI